MAEENATWGYRRIQGTLANLGHHIDKLTVRNILRRHHMEPAPRRRKAGMSWAQFLKLHWEVLAATDSFTVEVATWHGLVTYYVLVVMELATRRVQIAGITPHPTAAFMQQCARQLTDPFDGFVLGKRYLLHDRDTKFTQAFDGLLKASGVEPIVLPPRSPTRRGVTLGAVFQPYAVTRGKSTRSPTLSLTAPLSSVAVAFHLGPCAQLLRDGKRATSSKHRRPKVIDGCVLMALCPGQQRRAIIIETSRPSVVRSPIPRRAERQKPWRLVTPGVQTAACRVRPAHSRAERTPA